MRGYVREASNIISRNGTIEDAEAGVIAAAAAGGPVEVGPDSENSTLIISVVTLAIQARPGTPQRRVGQQLTDRRGRFVFVDLPASDGYLVTVRRNAYFDGAFGAEPGSVTGTPLLLGDGDWFDHAAVKLWPTGAIGGAVIDERGEPVAGAYVRVLRQLMVAGRVHLAPSAPVRMTSVISTSRDPHRPSVARNMSAGASAVSTG